MKILINILMAACLALFSLTVSAEAIDINAATAEQLEKGLKGIGPKKAADIVKYREANGPFQSVDDLAKVPGIKGKTLDKIRPMVTVGGAAPTTTTPAVPAIPTQPTMPAVPTKPTLPTTPAVPTKPTLPTTPAMPAKPTLPEVPATTPKQ